MKYRHEIFVDLSRERVTELFNSTDNLHKWQEGLVSFDHVSGEPGQTGAVSKLVFEEGGRRIEMTEKITKMNLPDEMAAEYQAKGVHNWTVNYFTENGPSQTKWVSENEFQFSGFMKIMAFFMKGSFPKRSMEDMNRFKVFAESNGA